MDNVEPQKNRFDWSGDISVHQSCTVFVCDWELQCCGHFSFVLGETVEWLIKKSTKEALSHKQLYYDYHFNEHDDELEGMLKLIGKVVQINGCWGKLIPDPSVPSGNSLIWTDEFKYALLDKADGWEEGVREEDAEGFRFVGYYVLLEDVRIADAIQDDIWMS